ncbi:hypothetical protein XENTR_v10010550 [Xenopus tropicalis]|nr:hypothetical protein XENTR_v10010550 [Xenopus tropicalis]
MFTYKTGRSCGWDTRCCSPYIMYLGIQNISEKRASQTFSTIWTEMFGAFKQSHPVLPDLWLPPKTHPYFYMFENKMGRSDRNLLLGF